MQYFTEQARTHREAIDRIRSKYGDRAKILTHRSVRLGGFLGLFSKEGTELTGYISQEPKRSQTLKLEEEKQKILKGVKEEQTLQQVLKELQSIKLKMELPVVEPSDEHPSLGKIEDLLLENDFSAKYIGGIRAKLKRELSIEDLEDFDHVQEKVCDWIAEGIGLYRENFDRRPKIVILVGPTGVGKTTTIAKLAAIHGLGTHGEKPKSVRMITIDNYRIGAKKQIETYGDIMGVPVACVESFDDLKAKLALFQEVDLILIDTIGKSPRDYTRLAEMRELLDACGKQAQVYLAVSATTKSIDLREIIKQFEPFDYKALVLTKLDETQHIGNVISILTESDKRLAYITDGQVVPQDIERASVTKLLMHMDGIRVNQERITERFDQTVALPR